MTDLEDTTTIPYQTFIYRYKSHEFGYVKELTDNSHLKLHNTISKLKHQGLGYRKISKKVKTTKLPFLIFTFQFKLDKKGEMIKSEYEDYNIIIIYK